MWIESHETMAVEGFMMQARVQRSAPDEVHTVTVVEKPTIEGSKGYLWSVETVYGQLVAEGSSPSEGEAKSEALAAAKADGGANDPEEFEQALQGEATKKTRQWYVVDGTVDGPRTTLGPYPSREAAEADLDHPEVSSNARVRSLWTDENGNIHGDPEQIFTSTLDEQRKEFTEGVMERYEALEEVDDPGRMSSQAAVASEDYPVLSEVLEERVPLEHNAGRFPNDDEGDDEVDIQPLGLAELASPGEDEEGLDPLLSSMVADSVDAIHGYVTGRHDDADRAYSSYHLLTSDERLSKTQRGSKAIHIYETAVR